MTEPEIPTPSKTEWWRRWDHIKHKYLVKMTETYIVFIDDEGDVDWETSVDYVEPNQGKAIQHRRILNEAALLETTPCSGLDDPTRRHFKRLIAEALTSSFEHDYTNAQHMLVAARAYHRARSEETSRLWYLLSSASAAFAFGVVAVCSWIWREPFSTAFGPGALWLTLWACAGAAGALLSVIARTGKLSFDCASGKMLHFTEGASRITAGALSGLLVGLAIRSGMFLTSLVKGGNEHIVIMVSAFSAGMAERLATSIISSVSQIRQETASYNQPTRNGDE